MEDKSASIIFKFTNWHVAGEKSARLALHVHGDKPAFAIGTELAQEIARLAEGEPLTLDELDTAIREFAGARGMQGYAGDCKCLFDPLFTVADISIYRRDDVVGETAAT